MTETIKEDALNKLNKKLVDLVNYTDDLKEEKKACTGPINEQIKATAEKIKYICKAIKMNDPAYLLEAFDTHELESLLK